MDYSQVSDEELIRLVCEAQAEALGALYERFGRMVFSVALRICGEQAQAEEITQDVFLRVWERAAAYRPEQGKVVAVGDGRLLENGTRVPVAVKKGQTVIFSKYGP